MSKKIKLFSILLLFLLQIVNYANGDQLTAIAIRADGKIKIDGKLDEADWEKAEPITKFVQIQPNEGEDSSFPTEVRILFDDKNLYFGFLCEDPNTDQIVANEMRRDSRAINDNDSVFILLDTYNDRRSGFFFRTTPLGALQDSKITNSGDTFNFDWNAVWESSAEINDRNWTAEIAVPFTQLRFRKSDEIVWGINIGREISRTQEEAIWSPVPKAYGGRAKFRTVNIGKLIGLEGISPSRNIEFLPYILPGVSRSDNEIESVKEIGFDLKYGITSNLTADLTINTDFAQVEADQEQVNLTRFNLFFPEKRPFFLEGAGLFDFGIPRQSFRRPPPLLLFYSRRIGLEEDNAIPILAGGKITGKIGKYGLGFLNVQTDRFQNLEPDDEIDISRTNYSVMRIRRDVLKNSTIGVMAVNKQDRENYNRAGGLDFSFRPIESAEIRGMIASTFSSKSSKNRKNLATYFGAKMQKDLFGLGGSVAEIGENFDPQVGFIQRTGVQQFHGEIGFTPWIKKFGIRRVWSGPSIDYVRNVKTENPTLESMSVNFFAFFEWENGFGSYISADRSSENLDESFEIRDGIEITADRYDFSTIRFGAETNEARKFGAGFGGSIGTFYDGTRKGFDLGVRFKPNGHFSFESRYDFNRIDLSNGSFDVSLLGARISYAFSTSLYAKIFTQWNSDGNVISTNFLLNYIYRPGSDFYLVLNQVLRDDDGSRSSDQTIVAKMTFWWNP